MEHICEEHINFKQEGCEDCELEWKEQTEGRPDLSHDADCTYRMGHGAPCDCDKDYR